MPIRRIDSQNHRDRLRRFVVLRVVALFGVAMLWAGGMAHACALPPTLNTLATTMAALPEQSRSIDLRHAQRMGTLLDGVSETAILQDLANGGLESLNGIALELLARAEELSQSGAPYDSRRLRAMLSEFHRQSTLACQQADTSPPIGSISAELAGVFTEGEVDVDELVRIMEENKVVTGGAVLVLIGAMIGILVVMDIALRWMFALIYNRRACLVAAQLETARGDVIEGHILTLGRGGFRFHPKDQETLSETGALVVGIGVALSVPELPPRPGRMSGHGEHVADFRFEEALSVRTQSEVLAQSMVSPQYVRIKNRTGRRPHLPDGSKEIKA